MRYTWQECENLDSLFDCRDSWLVRFGLKVSNKYLTLLVKNLSRKNLLAAFTRIAKRLLLCTQKKDDRLDRFFVEIYRKETCSAGLEFSLNMRLLFESLMIRQQLRLQIFPEKDKDVESMRKNHEEDDDHCWNVHLSLDNTSDDGVKITWCASTRSITKMSGKFAYEVQLKDESDPQRDVFTTIHTNPIDMSAICRDDEDGNLIITSEGKNVESLSISPLSRERSYVLRVCVVVVSSDGNENKDECRKIVAMSNIVVAEPHMSPTFAFDTNACGPNIDISPNGLTCKNMINKKWNSVRAHVGPGFSTGIHQWEVCLCVCVCRTFLFFFLNANLTDTSG